MEKIPVRTLDARACSERLGILHGFEQQTPFVSSPAAQETEYTGDSEQKDSGRFWNSIQYQKLVLGGPITLQVYKIKPG